MRGQGAAARRWRNEGEAAKRNQSCKPNRCLHGLIRAVPRVARSIPRPQRALCGFFTWSGTADRLPGLPCCAGWLSGLPSPGGSSVHLQSRGAGSARGGSTFMIGS